MPRKRIVVLMHERDSESTVSNYVISLLIPQWREDGHEVVVIFGTGQFIRGDVVFVHVDLSVVPSEYLRFAARYPAAVNGRVGNILKSTFSTDLLHPGDSWEGPVIVKSDRNFAGAPERARVSPATDGLLRRVLRGRARRFQPTQRFSSPEDYAIYDRLSEVPDGCFCDRDLIVQKFIPEVSDGMYSVRIMTFLGSKLSCYRLKGRHPIVNGRSAEIMEIVEPDPAIVQIRERLHFDYGKFDYVMYEGRAVLLDINKTIGNSPLRSLESAEMREQRRSKGAAICEFFS